MHRQKFSEALMQLEENFTPKILLISMGTDGSRHDSIHGFPAAFYFELGQMAANYCERHKVPLVVVCEGGYSVEFPRCFMKNVVGTFSSPYQVTNDGGISEA
jgi:acetoin utilization deacetylase AcuC-like enzyme